MTPYAIQEMAISSVLQAYGLSKEAGFISDTAKKRPPLLALSALLSTLSSSVQPSAGSPHYANPVNQFQALVHPHQHLPLNAKNQRPIIDIARTWSKLQENALKDNAELFNRRALAASAVPRTSG